MAGFDEIRRRNLDALLDLPGVGMFTADRELRVRSMNREAERLLGLTPGAGLGLTCREVLGPHLCSADCAFRRTMEDGRPRKDWLVRVVREAGVQRDLVLSTAFLEAPDPDAREVAVAIRDVTGAERFRRALRDRWVFHGLVSASPAMKEIFSLIREMAPFDSTALLLGESGTGKELVAKAIHLESPRRSRPFVTVDCPAYAGGLLESELFGHVEGAFTGATRSRTGRFEAANGGTVFLDEVGEIPLPLQVKLLRVLQERAVERVGSQTPVAVDVRIVAATNRDLPAEVRAGRFREDLYYRLNVIAIRVPPLRARREDIPALLEHFLDRHAAATGKPVTAFSDEALEALFAHDWPGNVRELENAVEHAVVRCRGARVSASDLPPEIRGAAPPPRSASEDLQARVEAALRACDGRVGEAAAILGVHRTTLWRWIRTGRVAQPEVVPRWCAGR